MHAKCNKTSQLFELTQLILRSLPLNSVEKFEDIYGFFYRNGRDLSGFIDGKYHPYSLINTLLILNLIYH